MKTGYRTKCGIETREQSVGSAGRPWFQNAELSDAALLRRLQRRCARAKTRRHPVVRVDLADHAASVAVLAEDEFDKLAARRKQREPDSLVVGPRQAARIGRKVLQRPNDLLDLAPSNLEAPAPDCLAVTSHGVIVSSDRSLLRVDKPDGAEIASFDAPISALTGLPDGGAAVGLIDGRIVFVGGERGGTTLGKNLEVACITALAASSDGALLVANGSPTFPAIPTISIAGRAEPIGWGSLARGRPLTTWR
jgi:hypothetical protein